ncbi:twin-arginine translocase subunit TatC [Halopelagius longus]|uniref:Sec-independent protein translocase protein TatC n=1 Tax=Halopelagius longus TaxID=1236180 RepID=A0A1H1EBH6_9EURY|nr:twin-arginine translocase subunit TatC [Halopelagius longus]RDI71686.1 preprotein translocase subunit TatC [Halopelagius longus]SDQ86083.1 sec-independent protein translocase protein TatC [Halopelagius longus]
MSSALDEDTQQTLAAGRETAGAMLRAAQKDLQKVFIVFLVGFLGTFYALRLVVWDFLKSVTEAQMSAHIQGNYDIIAQTPFDVILLQAKIGLVTGIILAAPVFLYFSRDALRERGAWPQSPVATWKLAFIVVTSAILFVVGVAYGYFVFFPFMFAFLAGNALSAGFSPTYSIVMWAQFIFLLTVSFGLAAQMPLAITGLSYAEIVPYETFRDKWRYAVVAIFVFGALFSPPDPFTQIMWALPLLFLYGGSLYLAKVVVTARRGSERISVPAVAKRRWNLLAGSAVVGGLLVYLFYERGGRTAFNGLLARFGSDYRVLEPGATLGLPPEVSLAVWAALGAAAFGIATLAYVVYAAIAESVDPLEAGLGDPSEIDVAGLDAAGVRAAPPEAFDDMTEDEAMAIAGQAVDEDDHEKAQAVLDRFDEAEERRESEADEDAPDVPEDAGTIEDRATRAGGTFLDELTEGEKDEDDIGGYYADLAFIFDSVTSKTFRIVAVFMLVLAGTFAWLYTGGIKTVYDNFLRSLPASVTPDEVINVVALHPVEALIFEVKFSTLVAALVTLPIVAYYAWPALRERNIVRQRRRNVFLWTGSLTAGLLGGFVLGYAYIAPTIISWLVHDAVTANMIIAYRITNFFWLIFFTTAGIGILADVPVAMVLLNSTGVSYQTMRNRWREVTVGVLAFAAVFTPAGIMTMFLVTVPLMVAYGIGLGVLLVVTLGGRRNLAPARGEDV